MKILSEKSSEKLFDSWESEAWAVPPPVTIDEWAEANIVLPRQVARKSGYISIKDLVPYLIEPLRAATNKYVEKITIKSSTQVGKTMFDMIVGLYYLAKDPWNVLHVAPRDIDAESVNIERYQPIIKESPTLACLIKDNNNMQRKFIRTDHMSFNFTGSDSPAGLASRSIAILILDEVNKYPLWTGKEASPISLATERVRTFKGVRKILATSTPTDENGYISKEYDLSSQERLFVPCPRCGHYQVLVFGLPGKGTPGIKWPEGERDYVKIAEGNLAWYECEACRQEIRDIDKPRMIREGLWVPKNGRVENRAVIGYNPNTVHRGFHLWAAYSPWLTFSEIAAEFLKSKNSPADYMNFVNSWRGEEYRIVVNELRTNELRAKIDTKVYRQGTVPDGAWMLTGGVDVQRPSGNTLLYYVIRAWGAEGETWLVKHGWCEGWETLYTIFYQSAYRKADGSTVGFGAPPFIDSGDGVNTLDIYDICHHFQAIPTKGASRPVKNLQWSEIDRFGVAGFTIPLLLINTSHYKTKVHRLIHGDKWHLPIDVEEDYLNQMVAEQLVKDVNKKSGQTFYEWRVRSHGAANHYFDADVLATVAADMLQSDNRVVPITKVESTQDVTLAEMVRKVERVFSK